MARLRLGPGEVARVYLPGDTVPATPPARSLRLVVIGQTPDTTAPTVPTGLVATAQDGQIKYDWTASTDAVGVSKYVIRRGGVFVADVASPTVTYTLTGLTNGTAVTDVTISAVDAEGNESAQAAFPSATPAASADSTAPSVPTGVSVVAFDARNDVEWTASTDAVGVAGYRIRRDGVVLATTAATSYADTGLTNGTTYSYTVAAYDAAGNESAQSAAVSGTPTAPTLYVTDMADETVGAAPVNWALDWVQTSTMSIVADATAPSGQVLRVVRSTGSDRAATRFVPSGTALGDVEVVVMWKVPATNGGSGRPIARGSGAAATETGYLAGVAALSTSSIGDYTETKYVGGVFTNLAGLANDFAADTWYYTRSRFTGGTLQTRMWAAGAAEPTTWALEVTDGTPITSTGWVGLFHNTASQSTDFAYFAVSTDGSAAPLAM